MAQCVEFFTAEQRQKICAFLDKSRPGGTIMVCPVCGNTQFGASGFIKEPLFVRPTDEHTTFVAPLLVTNCSKCNYVMLFGEPVDGFPAL